MSGKTGRSMGHWQAPWGQNENWRLSSSRRQRVAASWEGEGGEGKGMGSHGKGFQGGCGRLWLLTPTSLFSCAAHPLFSLRRFASRRHHPSPPHPYTYLPYSAQAQFCRILKLKSSHLTSSRLLLLRNRLLIFIHQGKLSSEARRPRTVGCARDRCRIAPYPPTARRIPGPVARKRPHESATCSHGLTDL